MMPNILIMVYDRIDEESPLWRMSPTDIQNSNFEIIVVLEGIIEPTGNTTQVSHKIKCKNLIVRTRPVPPTFHKRFSGAIGLITWSAMLGNR